MSQVKHNGLSFKIVRYYDNKAVIEIKDNDIPHPSYRTEKIENLTSNFGGGFEAWVKDNY